MGGAVSKLIRQLDIGMEAKNIPNNAPGRSERVQWMCTLTRPEGQTLSVKYSQGAHRRPGPIWVSGIKYYPVVAGEELPAHEVPHARFDRAGTYVKLSPPMIDDVLYTVLDEAGVFAYPDFKAWVESHGWDEDSREMLRRYRRRVTTTIQLRLFLGPLEFEGALRALNEE